MYKYIVLINGDRCKTFLNYCYDETRFLSFVIENTCI